MKRLILAVFSIFFIAVSVQAQTPYKLSQKEWAIVNALLFDDISKYYNGEDSITGKFATSRPIAIISRIYQEIQRVDGVGGDISNEAFIITSVSIILASNPSIQSCEQIDKSCVEEVRALETENVLSRIADTVRMLESSGWIIIK